MLNVHYIRTHEQLTKIQRSQSSFLLTNIIFLLGLPESTVSYYTRVWLKTICKILCFYMVCCPIVVIIYWYFCGSVQLLNLKMIFTRTLYSTAPIPSCASSFTSPVSHFLPFAFLCKQRWIYFIVWKPSHATTKIVQMKQVVNYIHTSANRLWIL